MGIVILLMNAGGWDGWAGLGWGGAGGAGLRWDGLDGWEKVPHRTARITPKRKPDVHK